MNTQQIRCYEALEKASADMLSAAREGDWDRVAKLEGACVLLVAQLRHAAGDTNLAGEEGRPKSRLPRRILVIGAESRTLAEPRLEDLDRLLDGKSSTLH